MLDIPFGKSYLYSNYPAAPEYIDEIKKIAKKENAIFFKYEPMTRLQREMPNEIQNSNVKLLKEKGFQKSQKEVQPQRTIILDLKKEEKELLSSMHKKTRYNIRLAKKRGIDVKEAQDQGDDFKNFWQLMQETAQRDKFSSHPKEYYKKLLELDNVKLYLAGRGGELHAAAIVIFYDGRSTYLHGASSYEYRRDMAPYLLHWEIIRKAKEIGIEEYDFWGIDETRWPGVTRFKRGFAGREVQYIGSWNLPIDKLWYQLYSIKSKVLR